MREGTTEPGDAGPADRTQPQGRSRSRGQGEDGASGPRTEHAYLRPASCGRGPAREQAWLAGPGWTEGDPPQSGNPEMAIWDTPGERGGVPLEGVCLSFSLL